MRRDSFFIVFSSNFLYFEFRAPGQRADSVREGTSAIAGHSMRDAGLLLIWVSVFFGTFLIGLSLIE